MATDDVTEQPHSQLTHTVYDGLTVELTPAPFWRRFLALAVDYGLLTVGTYLLILILVLIAAFVAGGAAAAPDIVGKALGRWFTGIGGLVTGVLVLIGLLVYMSLYHVYFIWYESRKGATPGKKIFGLNVVSLRGGRLTTGQCVSREVFRYVDLFLLLPGLIAWGVTTRRQRLGDLFAGCMVTWSESAEKSANFLYLTPESYHYLVELLKPRELSEAEGQRILQVAYPLFVLGKANVLSTLDLKVWADFADAVFTAPATAEINGEVKLRFIAELSFQKYGSQ